MVDANFGTGTYAASSRPRCGGYGRLRFALASGCERYTAANTFKRRVSELK